MMLFLLLLKLLFPSLIILLFSVLLASRDQLYHAKNLTFRKLENIDIFKFSADIASSMLCTSVHWDNIDALSDCFNTTLTDILDKHALLKTRIMINRPKILWFNADIKQLKHKRRRLEKKALKTDLPGDWNNYHKVRNQYSALLYIQT